MTDKARIDVHQQITDQIIAAIEKGGGSWEMPWHRPGTHFALPANVESKKRYNGINILSLWVAAELKGYEHHLWGTFRQWREKGAQVRKGEKASLVVFYKELAFAADNADTGESEIEKRYFARASWAFNVAQVEGYEMPGETPLRDLTEVLPAVDAYVANTGARIEHGSQMAFYRPSTDTIHMPNRDRFVGTATSSPTEAYYHTLLHELLHLSGSERRLNRDFGERFKSEARAFEEILVEIGAAYLSTDLGITPVARDDHAHYISTWLSILRSDKKAIFTAAAAASKAVAYLDRLQPQSRSTESVVAAEAA
jgi:antirestriction protein ArdC